MLASAGLVSGETGAAGMGGLIEVLASEEAAVIREAIGLGGSTSVLLISTEGATDPLAYDHIVAPSVVRSPVD